MLPPLSSRPRRSDFRSFYQCSKCNNLEDMKQLLLLHTYPEDVISNIRLFTTLNDTGFKRPETHRDIDSSDSDPLLPTLRSSVNVSSPSSSMYRLGHRFYSNIFRLFSRSGIPEHHNALNPQTVSVKSRSPFPTGNFR